MKPSEAFEGENSSLKKAFDNASSYGQLCQVCQYEEGHSPTCDTRSAQTQRAVEDLLSDVYGGKFSTKNRSVLIRKLEKIKEMCV